MNSEHTGWGLLHGVKNKEGSWKSVFIFFSLLLGYADSEEVGSKGNADSTGADPSKSNISNLAIDVDLGIGGPNVAPAVVAAPAAHAPAPAAPPAAPVHAPPVGEPLAPVPPPPPPPAAPPAKPAPAAAPSQPASHMVFDAGSLAPPAAAAAQ